MKVSIIIPVYNPGALLTRTLDSILAQTFTSFEVICVDDGSTDGSPDVLERYAARDARIKPVFQRNEGAGKARNNGLARAQGDYVYFCDHDDMLHPRHLEFCVSCLEKNGASAVFLRARAVSAKTTCAEIPPLGDFGSVRTEVTTHPFAYLKQRNGLCVSLPPWAYLARRELFVRLADCPVARYARFGYLVRLFASFGTCVVTDAPLYCYTSDNASMSRRGVTLQEIEDFHSSLLDAALFARSPESGLGRADEKAVMKHLVAKNLKYQYNRICRTAKSVPQDGLVALKAAFARELADFRANGCLPWLSLNIRHQIAFCRILLTCRRH